MKWHSGAVAAAVHIKPFHIGPKVFVYFRKMKWQKFSKNYTQAGLNDKLNEKMNK